eukprot:TRINITY_DN2801_c0_g1_i1.p1 TRINITY_DN2801_c0_g1~~TRINITY_DN2801_c0_g1_i1.p1  ORF type:complete len:986 (+),score=102.74 TRINITY_DN2801_c0_g1_i1:73-3030(+)
MRPISVSLLFLRFQKSGTSVAVGEDVESTIDDQCTYGNQFLSMERTQSSISNDAEPTWLLPWSSKEPWAQSSDVLTCGTSTFAPVRGRCPSACPFRTPDLNVSCHWRCVERAECGRTDTVHSVADQESFMCRVCKSLGCDECKFGADVCVKCMYGYDLIEGKCWRQSRHVWTCIYAGVVALVILFALYCLSLFCRPAVNPALLDCAIAHRVHASLCDYESGLMHSLRSNLRSAPTDGRAPIGGPGTMMFFNFQHSVLVWIFITLLAWVILGAMGNSELLILGTFEVHEPPEMCRAVQWGRAARDELRITKLAFIVSLYAASSIAVIIYGAAQLRNFEDVNKKTATMMDYALLCEGFPIEAGETVEADILSYLEEATALSPIGVSVCWDYADVRTAVEQLVIDGVWDLSDSLIESEDDGSGDVCHSQASEGEVSGVSFYQQLLSRLPACCLCQPCFKAIDALLGAGDEPPLMRRNLFSPKDRENSRADDGSGERDGGADTLALIESIKSSGSAVAVFRSEADRDAAMESLTNSAAQRYKGTYVIRPRKNFVEPDSMLWESFTAVQKTLWLRIVFGVLLICVAILVWGGLFYGPLAYYEISSYVASGEGPPYLSELLFTILVVIGNQIMYFLSDTISSWVGFNTYDAQQAAYVALYTCSVLANTVVDVGILVVAGYFGMKSTFVRTGDGILLSDLPDSSSVFRSQPMMKVFGGLLFEYCFPACFLLPYIVECAFLCYVLPIGLEKLVGGSRRLSRQRAGTMLKPLQMDLGRYGDILINLSLTAACFVASSGWVLSTLCGLFVGSLFIYIFDTWRVLRKVERFYLASFSVESLMHKMLALPCAILASALAFHVLSFDVQVMKNRNVFAWMAFAFVAHLVLHVFAITWLVPWLGGSEEQMLTAVPYEEAAKRYPGNWFSTNPVHCLRSACLHHHSPPCVYRIKGKEYVLRKNVQLGLFYEPTLALKGASTHVEKSNSLLQKVHAEVAKP